MVGGLTMLTVVVVPPLALSDTLVLRPGAWTIQLGSVLATVPGLVLMALLAPLVGLRRRRAWLALLPILNVIAVWRFGEALAQLHIGSDAQTRAPASPV